MLPNTITDMTKNETKRIEYLDLAKAVAILFMVWLHIGVNNRDVDRFVHVFHMPVFFIISGFCFKEKTSAGKFILKKTKTLLIPYFFWGTVLYGAWSLIYYILNRKSEIVSLNTFCYSIFNNNTNVSPYACVQWFFTTLFIANIIFYVIVLILKKHRLLLIVMISVCAYVGWMMHYLTERLPFGLDVSFMAVFFIGVGYLIREVKMKAYLIPIFGGLGYLTFILNKQSEWNMRTMNYGNPILYVVGACSVSICLLLLAKLLEDISVTRTVLKPVLFIGENSVWFLIFNQFYRGTLIIFFEHFGINIPKWCLLLSIVLVMIPTILIGNRFFGWSIGKKRTRKARENKVV